MNTCISLEVKQCIRLQCIIKTFSAVDSTPPTPIYLSHCCSPTLTLSLFLILLSPEPALSLQAQLRNSCIMLRSSMTQHFTLILATGWTWLAECLSKCQEAWPSPASCCSSTGPSSCTSTVQTFKLGVVQVACIYFSIKNMMLVVNKWDYLLMASCFSKNIFVLSFSDDGLAFSFSILASWKFRYLCMC